MHMNIFDDDAFSAVTMTTALEDVAYKPGLIGSMNLCENIPIATTDVAVERRGNELRIIKTSERGAPIEQGKRDRRNLRKFETTRIAKGHTMMASEIQNMRAFGSESELETMISYVGRYQSRLIGDVELTWENMQLGMVTGTVLDADGEVIVDWFAEWGIAKPAPIDFDLDNDLADPEQTCRTILRRMQIAAGPSWVPGTTIVALCGNEFFDKLTRHKKVREVQLNSAQALALNAAFGVATQSAITSGSYAVYDFGGIRFVNYRSTDDFDSDAAKAGTAVGTQMVGIPNTRARFFPVNARGLFQEAFAPGESFEFVNTIGRKLYSLVVRDNDRNFWVKPEIYSYPLFICNRPETLLEGKATAAG